MLKYVFAVFCLLGTSGCDEDVECGAGTKEVDGQCVAIEDNNDDIQNFYQEFTPATRSVQTEAWPFNVSITDITGNIACSLSLGFSNQPGLPGSQVFARFPNSSYQRCPVGTYGIDAAHCQNSSVSDNYSGMSDNELPDIAEDVSSGDGDANDQSSGMRDDEVGEDCARYRRWDSSGLVVANLAATGGAITVTSDGDDCSYELNLVFPGGNTFSDTFTVYVSPMEGGPYCTP